MRYLVISLGLGTMLSGSIAMAAIQVGLAQVNITPPLGIPMAGYYHERGATKIHDELYARAIVVSDGLEKVAMVSVDLITTRRHHVVAARRAIQRRCGIAGGKVMISATHAHTGPILATLSNRRIGQEKSNPLVESYSESLPDLIADAVVEANANLVDGAVSAAIGFEDALAFNRRFHMSDGSVGWNPGKLNPRIIKSAGPIDPDVGIVFFQTAASDPLGAYVNHAVHLDNVGGPSLSADLPFALSNAMAQVHGKDFLTMYVTGACGDVNHVNVEWRAPQKGHENAARMGVVLAGSVLRAWPDLRDVSGPLRVASETVSLELAPISQEEIAPSKILVREGNDRGREAFMKLVKAHQVLDVADRQGEPFSVEVQVFSLGNTLAWVALPGEVFVQLGLDLKLDSPFEQTMIAELANGSIGYIPNIRAYPQGNYEVVSARCAAGSGEKIVGTAVRLLKMIHAENLNRANLP